jgi:putative adhesin
MRSSTLGVLALAAALAAPAARAEDFRWSGAVAPGKVLEIKGVNGGIEAGPASGSEAEVTARKSGRRSDPDQVEIKVVEHGGGITICAVYPSPSDTMPNECGPGARGRMSTRDNDVTVEFTVRVPDGVRFVGRTVNGGVEAQGLTADAEVYSVNGGVTVSSTGLARAETVNGSIRAAMGRADWTGRLELKTVNGSITVEMPASAGARVEARTVNGGIETDFPLTVTGRFGPRRVSGTIGSGGRDLALETVNGGIHIRRGR